jgi:hypothetical protein
MGEISLVAQENGVRLLYHITGRDGAKTRIDEVVSFAYTATMFDGRRQWLLCRMCGRRCRVIYGRQPAARTNASPITGPKTAFAPTPAASAARPVRTQAAYVRSAAKMVRSAAKTVVRSVPLLDLFDRRCDALGAFLDRIGHRQLTCSSR